MKALNDSASLGNINIFISLIIYIQCLLIELYIIIGYHFINPISFKYSYDVFPAVTKFFIFNSIFWHIIILVFAAVNFLINILVKNNPKINLFYSISIITFYQVFIIFYTIAIIFPFQLPAISSGY